MKHEKNGKRPDSIKQITQRLKFVKIKLEGVC
jgi:hypothetical protein